MRALLTAALVTAAIAAVPAAAQVSSPGPAFGGSHAPRVSPNPPRFDMPRPQRWNPPRVSTNPPRFDAPRPQRWNAPQRGSRWGGNVNGRWHGGWNAPGGWSGYRRPSHGWTLPRYWMGSGFRIPDHHFYGLGAPPFGYFWVRYYDDAVLVDSEGRVSDWVSGIAWADADAEAGYGWTGSSASAAASASAVAGAPYPAPPACPQACPGYGYYYPAPVVTTVIIQSAPVVTTVTEEIIEEVVTTSYAPRRVVRTYRPATKRVRRCPCK